MNSKLILIVDDEEEICSELDGFLTQKGYQTVIATNGYDAYDLFISEMPVCVLSDFHMPVMNGLELLKKIKLVNKDVHVILISGVADIKIVVEAMKNEAFDFLSKPVDLKNLLTLVNIAIQKTYSSIQNQKEKHMSSVLYHRPVENNNDVSVLYFNKDLDEQMSERFTRYIYELLNEQTLRRVVIFQLENSKYINNIGLNFLIEMKKLFASSGRPLYLCFLGEQVSTYIRTLGYDKLFDIETNIGAVLERVKSSGR